MTIHLPKDLEGSVQAEMQSGHFASEDDLVAAAVREYLERRRNQAKSSTAAVTPDPVLGSMRDYAEEMDEIVADAMKRRREEPWRAIPGE